MATTLTYFIEGLKKRLADNQERYVVQRPFIDDDGSRCEEDVFELDALMREVDQFSAEFEQGRGRRYWYVGDSEK